MYLPDIMDSSGLLLCLDCEHNVVLSIHFSFLCVSGSSFLYNQVKGQSKGEGLFSRTGEI